MPCIVYPVPSPPPPPGSTPTPTSPPELPELILAGLGKEIFTTDLNSLETANNVDGYNDTIIKNSSLFMSAGFKFSLIDIIQGKNYYFPSLILPNLGFEQYSENYNALRKMALEFGMSGISLIADLSKLGKIITDENHRADLGVSLPSPSDVSSLISEIYKQEIRYFYFGDVPSEYLTAIESAITSLGKGAKLIRSRDILLKSTDLSVLEVIGYYPRTAEEAKALREYKGVLFPELPVYFGLPNFAQNCKGIIISEELTNIYSTDPKGLLIPIAFNNMYLKGLSHGFRVTSASSPVIDLLLHKNESVNSYLYEMLDGNQLNWQQSSCNLVLLVPEEEQQSEIFFKALDSILPFAALSLVSAGYNIRTTINNPIVGMGNYYIIMLGGESAADLPDNVINIVNSNNIVILHPILGITDSADWNTIKNKLGFLEGVNIPFISEYARNYMNSELSFLPEARLMWTSEPLPKTVKCQGYNLSDGSVLFGMNRINPSMLSEPENCIIRAAFGAEDIAVVIRNNKLYLINGNFLHIELAGMFAEAISRNSHSILAEPSASFAINGSERAYILSFEDSNWVNVSPFFNVALLKRYLFVGSAEIPIVVSIGNGYVLEMKAGDMAVFKSYGEIWDFVPSVTPIPTDTPPPTVTPSQTPTSRPSSSPTPTIEILKYDINSDGKIDSYDLQLIIENWKLDNK